MKVKRLLVLWERGQVTDKMANIITPHQTLARAGFMVFVCNFHYSDKNRQEMRRHCAIVHHSLKTTINMRYQTLAMISQIFSSTQDEYMKRAQRELKKKHALELKQQPKSLKQKEILIRKQFRDTCKIQTRQYKALKSQVVQTTAKDEQKIVLKKLKEEQRRKMALLGEQYEQTIAEMLQKQSVRNSFYCVCDSIIYI